MTKKPKVALIGAGAMGGALISGWLSGDMIACDGSAIFEPNSPAWLKDAARAHGVRRNPNKDHNYEIVVFAIKPQLAKDVLPKYAEIASQAVAVSVMAGFSVASLSSALGGAEKIVRAMPNLPAAFGRGATGLFASDAVSEEERQAVENLMEADSTVVWVEKESDIDLVTAVSGSGPAYFFLLAEALAEAGVSIGLKPEAAQDLARATLAGAGAMADRDLRSSSEIRKAVTSPGGTTAAALDVLDGDDKAIRTLMEKAVAAAAKRAGELAG